MFLVALPKPLVHLSLDEPQQSGDFFYLCRIGHTPYHLIAVFQGLCLLQSEPCLLLTVVAFAFRLCTSLTVQPSNARLGLFDDHLNAS